MAHHNEGMCQDCNIIVCVSDGAQYIQLQAVAMQKVLVGIIYFLVNVLALVLDDFDGVFLQYIQ